VKKGAIFLLIVLLLAAVFLQWGLDRTPAGSKDAEDDLFPSTTSLLDLLGGARQYFAYTFFIKTDKLHHTYYGSFVDEAELVPYLILATELDPRYISPYYVAVGIIDVQGNTDQAIELNLKGIQNNPESADLLYSLGALYIKDKRYEEAAEVLEKALEYDNGELASRDMILAALAASYHALGDMEAQREVLVEKAIYDQVRLLTGELEYAEYKSLVGQINNTFSRAVQDSRP
jgi:tetratricopeptide (TPR) repeat protein